VGLKVECSDVKQSQNAKAEAEDKTPEAEVEARTTRLRPSLRGQGQDHM